MPVQDLKMLLGIIYSEFDVVAGPVIRVQAPNNLLSQEVFESLSDYVITGKQLCGRTVTVNANNTHLMGVPLCIEHEKYARNALFCNVSFVFDPQETNTSSYEPVLRKLALTLYCMEIETQFLAKPKHKNTLGLVLGRVLSDLNDKGECYLPLDDANMLSLKLATQLPTPPQVHGHEVPVFLRDPLVLKSLDWDLALKQVIPAIDGVKYAKRLALETEMDEACVHKALRTLLYYDIIALVDIFQFHNTYTTTHNYTELVRNSVLQRKCQAFICKSQSSLLGVSELLRVYSYCKPEVTVADLLLAHKTIMNKVDTRRFITFGVVYGILRRVHRYPIVTRLGSTRPLHQAHSPATSFASLSGATSSLPKPPPSATESLVHRVQECMDGTRCMDALCCHFLLTSQQLEQLATTHDASLLYVYK